MLLREPALLHADLQAATRCLLELRIKLPGSQDVSRILMQQPNLLLADFSTLKCAMFSFSHYVKLCMLLFHC
jgi:hypothetical protein